VEFVLSHMSSSSCTTQVIKTQGTGY